MRSVAPSYDPGPEELVRIASICRRLDGLPLAVTGVVRRVVEECREALVTQLGAFPSESTVDPLAVPIVVVRAPELIARTERDLPAM